MPLTESQQAIVTAPSRHIPPLRGKRGSGKTRVLKERIRYLLDKDADCSVLALTFTNKASEEMKARVVDIQDIDSRCFSNCCTKRRYGTRQRSERDSGPWTEPTEYVNRCYSAAGDGTVM
jgi:superfamily I DNA/RNA helicase